MTDHTHTSSPAVATDSAPVATDDAAATPIVTSAVPPTVVVQSPEHASRRFHLGSFVTGFIAAAVVAALALVVFLVVSDSDDDGNIQLDVPAVNVDTGG